MNEVYGNKHKKNSYTIPLKNEVYGKTKENRYPLLTVQYSVLATTYLYD